MSLSKDLARLQRQDPEAASRMEARLEPDREPTFEVNWERLPKALRDLGRGILDVMLSTFQDLLGRRQRGGHMGAD